MSLMHALPRETKGVFLKARAFLVAPSSVTATYGFRGYFSCHPDPLVPLVTKLQLGNAFVSEAPASQALFSPVTVDLPEDDCEAGASKTWALRSWRFVTRERRMGRSRARQNTQRAALVQSAQQIDRGPSTPLVPRCAQDDKNDGAPLRTFGGASAYGKSTECATIFEDEDEYKYEYDLR
jgi:hypothetical protein